MKYQADVIVVGAGAAGLAAAVQVAEQGGSVVVLEKDSTLVNSSTAICGGWITFFGTPFQETLGIHDSEDKFVEDWTRVSAGAHDPSLLDAYARNQLDTYEWLCAKGVRFTCIDLAFGMSVPRAHRTEPDELVLSLQRVLISNHGVVAFNTQAISLITNLFGKVIGVVADTAEGKKMFLGQQGVILATGGFARNFELIRRYAPELAPLEDIKYTGKGSDGDGLKMALSLGAETAHLDIIKANYWCYAYFKEEEYERKRFMVDTPATAIEFIGGIIVNKSGKRFVNESAEAKQIAAAALPQEGNLSFIIFDQPTADAAFEADRARKKEEAKLLNIELIKPLCYKATTLKDLAKLIGAPSSNLIATVEHYNKAVELGSDDKFGRVELAKKKGERVEKIETAPFYAFPVRPVVATTYGGVAVDENARVKAHTGGVINGLYACGEIMGGFHGPDYMTGTSVGKGIIFGRIAARHILRKQ